MSEREKKRRKMEKVNDRGGFKGREGERMGEKAREKGNKRQ